VFVCAGLPGSRAAPRPEAQSSATPNPLPPAASASPDAATGITGRKESRGRARRGDQGSRLNALVAGILILAGGALLPMWRPLGLAGIPTGVLSYAPQGITQRLVLFNNLNSHAARVWNPQVWGSWLEFAVPGELVAVDSRIELFPTPIWDDVDSVSRGSPDAIAILDRYHPDFVIVERPAQSALEDALRATPAWACIYHDIDGSIWARSDTVLARGAAAC
jgi:hypothetical protein